MSKLEILNKYFGYNELKKEQEELINEILLGNDCIGLLPTGYGKSIVFQVPALLLDGLTIVITPLIALMQDQVNNLKKNNIGAECIHSGIPFEIQIKIYKNLDSIKLLYVSAERLLNQFFISEIIKHKISLIVLDEAHTVLWSEDFRSALAFIPSFIEKLGYRPPHLALTATATEATTYKIKEYVKLIDPKIIIGDFDKKNIYYNIVKSDNKKNDLIKYISKYKNELGIIYCLTIRNVLHIYDYLKQMNYKVGYYHGGMSSTDKLYMQNAFTNHLIDIIVCTNAFGMGIDIPNIRYVIEYDIPSSVEDFLQQSGRCSRDKKYGESIVLFNINDIKTANYFIEQITNPYKTEKELKKIRQDRYKKLDSIIEMCLTKKCIHQYVAHYFSQKHKGKCMMCSNCNK